MEEKFLMLNRHQVMKTLDTLQGAVDALQTGAESILKAVKTLDELQREMYSVLLGANAQRFSIPDDLPYVLNVQDIARIARVNKIKVYEWTRRKDFPKIKDGNRILIPRDAFFRWLHETMVQQQKNDVASEYVIAPRRRK